MSKVFADFVTKHKPIVLSALVFFILVIFINPLGNFPINDDWLFVRQVEAFSKGIWEKNVLIDPTFISQGMVGLVWSKIFGVGFESLRLLTMVVFVVFLVGVYVLLNLLKINKKFILVVLLLFVLNPLVVASSLTFMTDIYFLFFLVFTLYFYLLYAKEKHLKYFVYGSVFCGLTFLNRQIGLIPYIAMSLFLFVQRKKNLKHLMVGTLPIAAALISFYYWPAYKANSLEITSNIMEFKNVYKRLREMLFVLPALGFYMLPVTFLFSWKRPVFTIPLVLVLSWVIFTYDVLPLGSVFYLEGLHAKSGFRTNLSVFDNVIFKLLLSFLSGLSLFNLFYLLVGIRKKAREKYLPFLELNLLGFFLVLFVASDIYDRYLLPLLLVLIIYLANKHNKRKLLNTKLCSVIFVLFFCMTLFLNREYLEVRRLKWAQARHIQQLTGFKTGIFLDGTYTKYIRAFSKGDYSGLEGGMPSGLVYACYVQQYTFENKGTLFWKLNNQIEKYIANPKIYNRRKLETKRIKKHLDELIIDKEYFSLLYTIINKQAYVGSWCDSEYDN